jgi:CRISPR-associated protein Cas2
MKDSVIFLCYDIPVEDKMQKKEYTRFLKFLKRNGFDRIQKSVAIKYLKNKASYENEKLWIDKYAPKIGTIYVWCLSYNKYCSVVAIRGNPPATEELSNPLIEI